MLKWCDCGLQFYEHGKLSRKSYVALYYHALCYTDYDYQFLRGDSLSVSTLAVSMDY